MLHNVVTAIVKDHGQLINSCDVSLDEALKLSAMDTGQDELHRRGFFFFFKRVWGGLVMWITASKLPLQTLSQNFCFTPPQTFCPCPSVYTLCQECSELRELPVVPARMLVWRITLQCVVKSDFIEGLWLSFMVSNLSVLAELPRASRV